MSLSKASNENKLFNGIKARNLNEIKPKFICAYCQAILLYPWQILCCGTLLCRYCCKYGLSNSEPFLCPFCETEHAKKEASSDRGNERELNRILIACYICSWNGLYKDYLDHLLKEHAVYQCIDCEEQFFAINSLGEHQKELCFHRCISCELPDCMDSIKWYDISAHYLSDKHQNILLIIVSQYIDPKYQQSQIRQCREVNKQELLDIKECIESMISVLETFGLDLSRLKIEQIEIRTIIEQNVPKIDELKKLNKKNEGRLKEILDSQDKAQLGLESIKRTMQEFRFLILDNNCTTTLRFNYPNTASFSLNSDKFKTSNFGYIFSLRVSSTKNSEKDYLSIFLTLHSGKYDSLIFYPFLYNIHLILWDQSNQQKHIEHVIKPNPKSTSFMQPINEKNDEYDIMKFCLLNYLTDAQSPYVKDGIFFIRIFIDFLNTGQNPFQMKSNIEDTEL